MREQILDHIAQLSTPGFFIVVDFWRIGKEMPTDRVVEDRYALKNKVMKGR